MSRFQIGVTTKLLSNGNLWKPYLRDGKKENNKMIFSLNIKSIKHIAIKFFNFAGHGGTKGDFGFLGKLIIIFLIALMPFFSSCINDDVTFSEEKIPEGMTQISFILPDYEGNAAQFGTRAFNTAEEGYMSNLYVVAIKYENWDVSTGFDEITDDSGNKSPIVYTFALNPVGIKFEVGEKNYKLFNIALYPGKYKFGLVANVDLYLKRQKKISDFTKEEDLENIVLNFSEDTPLAPLHLPMACLPWEIQWSDKDHKKQKTKEEDYLVPVLKGNETQIYADMQFLCSKVRYTILFDRDGISSAFGNTWIRFNVDDTNRPTATNIRKQTKLVETSTGAEVDQVNYFVSHLDDDSEKGWWSMSIDRFKWSEEEVDNYPKKPTSELDPWTGTTDDWIRQRQKVWQGVVYLPENDGDKYYTSEEDENGEAQNIEHQIAKTILRFPFHTKANDLDDTPWVESPTPKEIILFGNDREEKYEGLDNSGEYSNSFGEYEGLKRNYFYDVVAKVKNPDQDMDIRIFISILPWHEIEQTIPNEDDLFNKDDSGTSQLNEDKYWNYNSSTGKW